MKLVMLLLTEKQITTQQSIIEFLPNWILVIFTLFSLVISVISLIIANRSYNLSKLQEEKSKPILDLFYSNSKFFLVEKFYLYIFEFNISNISSSNNAIKKVELAINYEIDGINQTRYFQHSNTLMTKYSSSRNKLPLAIDYGVSTIFYPTFDVIREFKDKAIINEYKLLFYDTYGNIYEEKISLICEVINHEDMA